jgi:hypothetical protein
LGQDCGGKDKSGFLLLLRQPEAGVIILEIELQRIQSGDAGADEREASIRIRHNEMPSQKRCEVLLLDVRRPADRQDPDPWRLLVLALEEPDLAIVTCRLLDIRGSNPAIMFKVS